MRCVYPDELTSYYTINIPVDFPATTLVLVPVPDIIGPCTRIIDLYTGEALERIYEVAPRYPIPHFCPIPRYPVRICR